MVLLIAAAVLVNDYDCELPFVVCFLGRIHAAVVSNINLHTRSVTVEWSEKGETKGKEVTTLEFFFRFSHQWNDMLNLFCVMHLLG